MKAIFIALTCFIGLNAAAVESIEIKLPSKDASSLYESELMMAFFAMGEKTSPMIGAGVGGEFFEDILIGARALMPMSDDSSKTDEVSAAQIYARYLILNTENRVFAEATGGYASITGRENFLTGGVGFGAQYRVLDQVSLGGIVGTEFASKYVGNNNTNMYTKLAITTAFYF
jgi:hypothetical protein